MSEVDRLWSLACAGDKRAFGDWMGRVERPILRALWRFASAADTESVFQETMLRMWHLSQDHDRRLEGENASLRFAIATAHNLARNMARKHKHEHLLPSEDLPGAGGEPHHDPPSDPLLAGIIRKCIEALKGPLRKALVARLEHGHRHNDEQAESVGMTRNTFLQNVTRARKYLEDCLRRHDVHEHEALR